LAGLLQLKDLFEASTRPSTEALLVGTVVSFIAGIAAIRGLLTFVKSRSMFVFVVYRIGLGLLLLGMLTAGMLQP
jgi:undecaprenyl-diphosphatase